MALHVLARHVNVPERDPQGRPLNFTLARSANPSHLDVAIEGLVDQAEALAWFDKQPERSGAWIFPLSALSPADRAKVRRAIQRRKEFIE